MPELHRILSIEIEGFSEELRVVHFEGYEGISQLFEFEVTVGAESSAIAFADIVRKKASLTIHPDGEDHPRLVHGVVSRFEQGSPHRRGSTYRITVVPWAWMLEQRVDSRIFQDMTAPDIVQKVLQAAGYTSGDDFKLSLQGTYVTRDYCVQYRETDWDFVSRLLEEEGIAYFFEHDEAKHTLVLVDRPAAWPPIAGEATLIFRQAEGALGGIAHGTHVTRFAMSEEVRPGKVTLRDWNFEKPALKLEADKEAAKDTNLEVYDQPGEYGVPADGEALAAVRLEELQAPRRTGRGESTCARLSGGHELTLSEHPREDFNTGYLVTRVEHWGTEPDMEVMGEGSETPYRNRFEAIPSTVVFRPARVTRRPQIHGVQTAIVVGPQGEEIYADKHGRVKVQFHWDRLGKNDDKSSCWVRVAQMWASAAFGAMFLPRVKDEVVVAFLEGDPDKPLVVGRVYHGTNVVPYALPDEKTKSTIKSHSSPQAGDDAFNELRFEDKKGSEEVFLQAQKDWTINVKNDKNQKVGHDETLEVGNDRTKTVKHDQTATIEHDDTLTVKNDQTATIEHDQSLTVKNDRTVEVDKDHTETVKGNQSVSITKAQTVKIDDKQEVTVAKTRALKVTGDVTESFGAKLTVTVTDDVSETLSAKRTVSVSGDHAEKIGGKQTIDITGDSIESVTGKKSLKVTGNVTIESGSSKVTITPDGEIKIEGVQITIDASGPLKVHGATVDVKSDGPATVKAPVVKVEADGVNTIKGAMVTLDGQLVSIG